MEWIFGTAKLELSKQLQLYYGFEVVSSCIFSAVCQRVSMFNIHVFNTFCKMLLALGIGE